MPSHTFIPRRLPLSFAAFVRARSFAGKIEALGLVVAWLIACDEQRSGF